MVDDKSLKEAQAIMFEMLVELDRVCRKYNLSYWLDSGTLLGAVRDGGFIPWDDDVDISMPVEDYREFCKVAQSELPSSMFLQNRDTQKSFLFDYTKIRDSRARVVEFFEEGRDVDYHQGVFLDIFPMVTIKRGKFYSMFYRFSFFMIRLFSAKKFNLKSIRYLFVSLINSFHLGFKKRDSKNIDVIYGGEMPDVAATFAYDSIFPLREIEFEGSLFLAPNDYKSYLTTLYGKDYMIQPPEDKRVVHASSITIAS